MYTLRILCLLAGFMAITTVLGAPAPEGISSAQVQTTTAAPTESVPFSKELEPPTPRKMPLPADVASPLNVTAVIGNDFLKSCWYVKLREDGFSLAGCCGTPWGYNTWTQLDLRTCLGNNNGQLVPTKDGRFDSNGCRACNWLGTGTGEYSCYCDSSTGSNIYTTVRLVCHLERP